MARRHRLELGCQLGPGELRLAKTYAVMKIFEGNACRPAITMNDDDILPVGLHSDTFRKQQMDDRQRRDADQLARPRNEPVALYPGG